MTLGQSIFYRTRAKGYSWGATSGGPRHTYSSYTSATPNYQPGLEASATGSHQSSESTSIPSWSPSTSSSLIHSPIHQSSSSGSLQAFWEESSRAGRLDADSWSVSQSSSPPRRDGARSPQHLPRPHIRQSLRNSPATSRLLTRQRCNRPRC